MPNPFANYFDLQCPYCDQTTRIEDDRLGTVGPCAHCGQDVEWMSPKGHDPLESSVRRTSGS